MPAIRVEGPKGRPDPIQRKIRADVELAVLKALAPQQSKHGRVAVREVTGIIGDV